MTRKHRVCVRWIWAALAVSAAVSVLLLFWLLRPYDAVRVSGDIGSTSPRVVEQGGTVTVTRKSVCNDGVDVTVHRWADSVLPDGRVAASFDLGVITFYGTGEPTCFEPSVSGVTLPNYVIGPDGGPGTFRLRFDLSYRANPVRVVTVSSVTDTFVVVPEGATSR